MAVRQIATHPRCKICQSPHRSEIDALLEIRHDAGRDEKGRRVTQGYVMERMAEWGIVNPTVDNIRLHVKSHVEFISNDIAAEIDAASQEVLEMLSAGGSIDADAVLDRIIGIGHAELEAKVKNGQKTGIGVETILKAIQVKTSRRTHEAQTELLKALGGGITAALAGGTKPPQIEEAPIEAEDADFEEIGAS